MKKQEDAGLEVDDSGGDIEHELRKLESDLGLVLDQDKVEEIKVHQPLTKRRKVVSSTENAATTLSETPSKGSTVPKNYFYPQDK